MGEPGCYGIMNCQKQANPETTARQALGLGSNIENVRGCPEKMGGHTHKSRKQKSSMTLEKGRTWLGTTTCLYMGTLAL